MVLGNLDSKRDWGYAGDYVKGMWLMLQQDEPDDYVLATGETYSIEDLVRQAFAEVGIDNWADYVRQDPKFLRPAEVDLLIGDATKARTKLGWEPEVDFPDAHQDDGRPRPATRSHQSRHRTPRLTPTPAREAPATSRSEADLTGVAIGLGEPAMATFRTACR